MTQAFTLHANDTVRVNVLANCKRFLDLLPASKSWRVEISQWSKSRSLNQNAAAYGVAEKALMEFMGLRGESDKRQLHRDLCCLYFGFVELPIGRRPKRTTTTNENGERDVLSAQAFSDFYSFIQQQGAEIGCYVPSPGELE